MHYHTFASAMPSVERTTASAGEVVVAHPSPATVDGMSGDLGEKGRAWLWNRSCGSCIYLEHPATLEAACRVTYDAAQPDDHTASIRLGVVFCLWKTLQGAAAVELYTERTYTPPPPGIDSSRLDPFFSSSSFVYDFL